MDPILNLLFDLEDEFDEMTAQYFRNQLPDRHVERLDNWFEEILPNYSDYYYRRFHRLCRDAMSMIIFDISRQGDLPTHTYAMSMEKRLHLFVNYAANIEPLRLISDRFGCGEATAMRVIDDMAKRISRLSGKYIRWPTPNQAATIRQHFSTNPHWYVIS